MSIFLALVLIAALPCLFGLAFLLGRRAGPADRSTELSAVSRQHFALFQGGELNPRLVEATKSRFQRLLERGQEAAVEASLRPGEQFVVQVRALAELGTDVAGRILERQLERHLSDDHLEQTWYRIDLANGLRQLNREESLPHLLRCADFASQAALGPVFAAETLAFLGFAGYLRQAETPLGESALRLLHRVLEGFRTCLPPQAAIETRLGELIEAVWDGRPAQANPLVCRVLMEARRYRRRLPAAARLLSEDAGEREAFLWQSSRLEALEPALDEYLHQAAVDLLRQLPDAPESLQRELLLALRDLRAESAEALLPLVRQQDVPLDQVVEVLAWSRDPRVGPWLCSVIRAAVPVESRARRSRRPFARRRGRLPAAFPYAGLLRALRSHPSADAEAILIEAAGDRDPRYRLAALESLGWYAAYRPNELSACLEENRRHAHQGIRRAARAALARLGERSALQWFRQALSSKELPQTHEAIHAIASEGLTLLWPDLDRLVDADNAELAYHAHEALAVLSEEMDFARR